MKTVKPIKRSPVLVDLSRDHHFGLLLVWKIRQGFKNNIDLKRLSSYIVFFFENDLLRHFKEEETLLFTKLDEQSELRIQAEADHAVIYQLVEQIKQHIDDDKLIKLFVDKLEEHIRFEERQLFNHIQTCLSENELTEIAGQFSNGGHDIDKAWQDEFWTIKK